LGHGRYKLWAAVASIVFHIIVLSVLAAARLYPESTQAAPGLSEQACLAKVRSIMQSSPVTPKPNVRHVKGTRFISRQPNLPTEDESVSLEIRAAGNEPVFPAPGGYADLAWSQQNSAQQEVKFFSSGAYCKRICYLVDCSGSMKGSLEQVTDELAKSIAALGPDQYFGIVFFGDNRVLRFAGGKLIRASQDSKTRALAFIKTAEAAGRTNALAGFTRAFEMRDDTGAGPEVIMFLTDGFELSQDDAYRFRQNIIDLCSRYPGRCIINTIGFWPSRSDRRLLESIAGISGGQFICVGGQDS